MSDSLCVLSFHSDSEVSVSDAKIVIQRNIEIVAMYVNGES